MPQNQNVNVRNMITIFFNLRHCFSLSLSLRSGLCVAVEMISVFILLVLLFVCLFVCFVAWFVCCVLFHGLFVCLFCFFVCLLVVWFVAS